jgi:hypothetical protein
MESVKQTPLNAKRNYLLSVADNDKINVIGFPPSFEVSVCPILIINVQKAAFWLSEQAGVMRNCVSFGRRVDDRKHLIDVVESQLPGVNYCPRLPWV